MGRNTGKACAMDFNRPTFKTLLISLAQWLWTSYFSSLSNKTGLNNVYLSGLLENCRKQREKLDRSEQKKQAPSNLAMRQSPKSDNYLLQHTSKDIQHPRIGNKWEDEVGWEVTSTRETPPPMQAQWHSLEMSPNCTALDQLGKLLTESTSILQFSANP